MVEGVPSSWPVWSEHPTQDPPILGGLAPTVLGGLATPILGGRAPTVLGTYWGAPVLARGRGEAADQLGLHIWMSVLNKMLVWIHKLTAQNLLTESALSPIQSESRDVRPSVCLWTCVKFILRPLIGPEVT